MKTLIQNQTLAARTCAGSLPCAILLAGPLAAPAQPIQPEVLFNFPRGPANPYAGLTLGSDGGFYGTTIGGGSRGFGTVFRVTTNGALTTLVSFDDATGANPQAALTLGNDGNFYGTTAYGEGTVFKVTTDGTLTTLVSFNNANGVSSRAALALGNDGNFYGTTYQGGSGGVGTVFQLTTNGIITTLVSFNNANGANPAAALTQGNDGYFYGTTLYGGANPGPSGNGYGTVFRLRTNGAFARLVSFNGANGAGPAAGLTLGSDGNFYGTTASGGSGDFGTVFRVTTNGTLTTLASFDKANGAYPNAALTLGSDGNFYGTTYQGGTNPGPIGDGYGTVFQVTPNGALTTLVSFNNADGANPLGSLTVGNDGNLYGTTQLGGRSDFGTVFQVTPNGTLTTLVSFANAKGANPIGNLAVGSDGHFYGTTQQGGSNDDGTVFRMTTNGTFTTLIMFDGTNGALPQAGLTADADGHFYGTTGGGGSSDLGTVFRLATNGTLTTLVSFDSSTGYGPRDLTLGNDGSFYGTTYGGGSSGHGTVFRVTTNGTLTTLASFNRVNGSKPTTLTLGNDGSFYGTAEEGGDSAGSLPGYGTVFKVTTNGTLTRLVSLDNANGAYPYAGLTPGDDGNFYGTTLLGGAGAGPFSAGYGTVFRVTSNGTLTTLVSFDGTSGASPNAPLTLGSDGNFIGMNSVAVFHVTTDGLVTVLAAFDGTTGTGPRGLTLGSDGNFYGTTSWSGSGGLGTVYRLGPLAGLILGQPQPASQVVRAGVNVTINVGVFGTLPLSYQWTLDSTNLPGKTKASLTLNNVSPSMSGNYALRVTNNLGTALSSNAVLTVLPAIVSTLPVSRISAASAVLNGSVTLGPIETLAWFEWGTDTNYGQVHGVTNLLGGSGTVTFGKALTGLDGDLIYHYRVVASNNFGIVYGTDRSFQVGLKPTAFTLSATVLTTNSVALNATVNPGGRHTTVWFKWGTNTSYGNLTPATSVGSGSAPLNFNNLIPGLSLGRLYHCQVVASNNLGLVTGDDVTFLIGVPGAPLAVTGLATFVTGTNAYIHGRVTPNLLATIAWFEWGTDTNYGNTVLLGDVGNVGSALAVSNFLNGLDAAVTYHFRLAASNSVGIAFGADAQISTSLNAYAESVLADQPLVYYRFDEANGTTALNSGLLGAPANGTYNATVSLGNPGLVPAFGYAAGFNNTNSSVAVPALGTNNQVTIEFWAKPRSFSAAGPGNPHSSYNSIYTADNYFTGALHTHFVNPFPNQRWQLAINPSHTDIEAGNAGLFPSNSWVHLAATHDSAARKTIAYVNGRAVLTNNSSTTVPVSLAAAHIGAWIGTANWFDGGIDEFAIYGSVLPASRIQAHYQTAIGNPVLLSAQTTNKLNFSWIGPGFRLQRNANLSNAAGWINVPAASNSPVSVTISNSGNQFYRLRWP